MSSHEAGNHFVLIFTIKRGKSSVMVIGRELSLNLYGEIHMNREVIYNLFLNFYVSVRSFSFCGPRKSDEGADTDLINNF